MPSGFQLYHLLRVILIKYTGFAMMAVMISASVATARQLFFFFL